MLIMIQTVIIGGHIADALMSCCQVLSRHETLKTSSLFTYFKINSSRDCLKLFIIGLNSFLARKKNPSSDVSTKLQCQKVFKY